MYALHTDLCSGFSIVHLEDLKSSGSQHFPNDQHIMLQIILGRNTHSGCKWDQMHLKVRGYKNLVDRVSDSTSQITFKRLPFVELWGCVKEEYPQLSEKEIYIYSLPFQLHIYVKPGFVQYTSVKTTYGNTECQSRCEKPAPSLKSDLKRWANMNNNDLFWLTQFWKYIFIKIHYLY